MELDLNKARVTYSYDNKVKDRRVSIPSKIVNQLQERDDIEEKVREAYKRWLEELMKNMIEDEEEEL